MNPATIAYTPLESYLLAQLLRQHGIEAEGLLEASRVLTDAGLVKADPSYDASRLTPDGLQQHFLQLLRDDLAGHPDNGDGIVGEGLRAQSPNPRKRKLASAPITSLRDAHEHVGRLPILSNKLYNRYRAHVISEIRADEDRALQLQKEIEALEQEEREEAARRDGVLIQNGETTPVPRAGHGQALNGPKPRSPYNDVDHSVSSPLPRTRSPLLQAQASGGRYSQDPLRPPQATPQVLQAPQVGRGLSPRPRSRHTTPGAEGLQRPDAAGTRLLSSEAVRPMTNGDIRWETPNPQQSAVGVSLSYPSRQPQTVAVGTGQSAPPWNQGPASPYALQQQQEKQAIQTPQQPGQAGVLLPPQRAAYPPPTSSAGPIATPGPQFSQSMASPSPLGTPSLTNYDAQSFLQQTPNTYQNQTESQHQATSVGSITSSSLPAVGAPGATREWPSPAMPSIQSGHVGTPSQLGPIEQQQAEPHLPAWFHALFSKVPKAASQTGTATPTATQRQFRLEDLPQTPLGNRSPWFSRSNTRWTSGPPTPSTSRPGTEDIGLPTSPAWEPIDPMDFADTPEASTAKSGRHAMQRLDTSIGKGKRGGPRGLQKPRESSRLRSSMSVDPIADDSSAPADEGLSAVVKDEDDTPRLADDLVDHGAASKAQKRKRRNSSPMPGFGLLSRQDSRPLPAAAPALPGHVLWTRGFPRTAKTVLDQIRGLKSANTFANPVKEKHALGYHDIVLQPQDLKSIQMAINRGNRAAVDAAQALVGGDPGTSSVWLPVSEGLLPPAGIINSAQLERELLHMFANAIMYSPDPNRGPGPAFYKQNRDQPREDDSDADEAHAAAKYEMDENSIVNETRDMFLTVQKLICDLRNAETRVPGQEAGSGAPPTGSNTPRNSSVVPGASGVNDASKDESHARSSVGPGVGTGADDLDEAEGSGPNGTTKRRRITRAG